MSNTPEQDSPSQGPDESASAQPQESAETKPEESAGTTPQESSSAPPAQSRETKPAETPGAQPEEGAAAKAEEAPGPARKKWSRVVLLLFLLAAVAVLGWEFRARWYASSTYKALTSQMEKATEAGGSGIHKSVVPLYVSGWDGMARSGWLGLLAGSPKKDDTTKGVDVFTWRGVFKKYKVRVHYAVGGFVKKVEQE